MKSLLIQKVESIEFLPQIKGARVGKIMSIDESGQVFVDFPGNTKGPVPARLTDSAKNKMPSQLDSGIGEILLAFENNDPNLPIIVDTIHAQTDPVDDSTTISLDAEELKDVLIDGERVTFDAKKEIVLRCGKASITLTRAGKIIIRGASLLNRSSGVNRIKGASVQIN
jgi:hypothetical protein